MGVVCWLLWHVPAAYAETRNALVIGVTSPTSHRTTSDADTIAQALAGLGFQVVHENDVTRDRFNALLKTFTTNLKSGGTGLFFYAGHGAQVNGVNYLLPRGAVINALTDVQSQWINLDDVSDALAHAPLAARFILLDACRLNPFLATLAQQNPTQSAYLPGLAKPNAQAADMLISYSTSPDNLAVEGFGQDDWYTVALNKYLGQAGVDINDILQQVNLYVGVATTDQQHPWASSSLRQKYYFRAPEYVTATLESIDDTFVLSRDGEEVMASDGPTQTKIALHVGVNKMVARVYNQHTFTGGIEGLGGHLPEGWNYRLRVRDGAGHEVMPVLQALEDRPQKDGPHHGHMFTVATFSLVVDEQTAIIQAKDIDPDAWKH